jgi:hypothetical protein
MIELSCDILVVGGGVAGIAAAVRAAREGAHTIIAEKNAFPGGTAVNCMHRYICGLYSSGSHIPDSTLNGGIADEICAELKKLSPGTKPVRMGKVYLLPFKYMELTTVLKSMNQKQSDLEILYDTKIVSSTTEDGNIRIVEAKGFDAELRIFPRAVIDCSGEGAVIRMSGASYRISPPEERQLAGFCFRISGIKDPEDMLAVTVPYHIYAAVNEKRLSGSLKYTKFYQGDSESEGYCLINIPSVDDPEKTGKAKENAVKVHDILKREIPSFRDSQISGMSFAVAEREGLRMNGEYILTEEDVLSGKKFNDGVVKSSWPIELWNIGKGPAYRYLESGAWYEIPLRCLKSINIKNLYCAGRCISASPAALGSTRVMGTCISLGEQAGLAAVKERMIRRRKTDEHI